MVVAVAVAVAATVGSQRTVGISYGDVEFLFDKFARGKVLVDRWASRVDLGTSGWDIHLLPQSMLNAYYASSVLRLSHMDLEESTITHSPWFLAWFRLLTQTGQ